MLTSPGPSICIPTHQPWPLLIGAEKKSASLIKQAEGKANGLLKQAEAAEKQAAKLRA